jgi:ATP-dependent Clp protease ATP-binding subunit ClpA
MKRALLKLISNKVADAIIKGEIKAGGRVLLSFEGNKLVFKEIIDSVNSFKN